MQEADNRKNRINDLGFSLVEMIAVIAIIGILTGGITYGISLVFSRDAERCATAINDALNRARMESMSRPDVYILKIETRTEGTKDINVCELRVDDGTPEGSLVEAINLDGEGNSKKTNVDVKFKSSSSSLTLPVTIQFDKQKGNVKKVTANGTDCTSEDILCFNVAAIRGNSNRNKSVQLITTTGKHSIGPF